MCCKKKRRIFCFGDSNTYGYDARSAFGERLPQNQRWPNILQELSGWEVINGGRNGRVIPGDTWFLERFRQELLEHSPVDEILIMLGTNDLLQTGRPDAKEAGSRMEQFLRFVLQDRVGEKIFLVAPPPVQVGRFRQEDLCYDREAERLGACYKKIASRYGLGFADTGEWEIPLAWDGVHITPEGHRKLAERLYDRLKKTE